MEWSDPVEPFNLEARQSMESFTNSSFANDYPLASGLRAYARSNTTLYSTGGRGENKTKSKICAHVAFGLLLQGIIIVFI